MADLSTHESSEPDLAGRPASAPSAAAVVAASRERRPSHRWPLDGRAHLQLLAAYAALTAAFVAIGRLLVGPLDDSVGASDRDLAVRLVDGRTATLDDLSWWGSMLAETAVKIALTLVVLAVVWLRWRHWQDAVLIAGALVLEASAFLTITLLVGRHRPDVPRLDSSPVDSSFPSGHVAAAVVYGAVAIVVGRHARRHGPVVVAVLVTVAIALAVAWARMYRGMHHLSDVVGGVVLGVASLYLVWRIVIGQEARVAHETPAGVRGGVS